MRRYANKVGPFSNPSETYQYFDLPFCRPEGGLEHKPETLGEVSMQALAAGAESPAHYHPATQTFIIAVEQCSTSHCNHECHQAFQDSALLQRDVKRVTGSGWKQVNHDALRSELQKG